MSRANPLTTHENAGIAAGTGVQIIWDWKVNDYASAWDLYEHVRIKCITGKLSGARVRRPHGHPNYLITKSPKGNIWLRSGSVLGSGNCIAIALYDTEIVRYYPNGTFSVDNGGFNTPTTSNRVTQFCPPGWFAFHERKQLCLHGPNGERIYPATHDRRIKP